MLTRIESVISCGWNGGSGYLDTAQIELEHAGGGGLDKDGGEQPWASLHLDDIQEGYGIVSMARQKQGLGNQIVAWHYVVCAAPFI